MKALAKLQPLQLLLTQHVQSAPIGGLPVFMKAALHDVAQNVNETVAKAKKILAAPSYEEPLSPLALAKCVPNVC